MGLMFDINVENEQIVLGALIADEGTRARWLPRLRAELFVDPVHQRLFEGLGEIAERGVPYAADTLVQLTGEEVKYKYLRDLEKGFGALPDGNLQVHLDILKRDAAKERARQAFERTYAALDDAHTPIEEAEAAAAEVLAELRAGARARGRAKRGAALRDAWLAELADRGPGHFAPLHLTALDEHLYEGARPGRVIVVAARPGMGKSTFVANLLARQVERGRRWLAVPVEAGTDSLLEQMVCAKARVPAEKLVKAPHELSDEELTGIKMAAQRLLRGDLLQFADEVANLDELEAMLRAEDYAGAVLDLFEYLVAGRLEPGEVTQALRRLRAVARETATCIVVVHQIRRPDRSKDPRPRLHELKHSGGYEEVADLVLLLHRDRYYDPDAEEDVLEVRIAKQRRGPQNITVAFEFQPEFCRVGKHVPHFDPQRAF